MITTSIPYDPPPALADAIKHFYCIQSDAAADKEIAHLSPNFDMLLVFNFGAPFRISFAGEPLADKVVPQVAVTGPLKRMLNYEILPHTDILVVVFHLDGFYRLFGTSPDDADSEKITDPDTLLQQAACHDLWITLKSTARLPDRVQLLGNYIQSVIRPGDPAGNPLLDSIAYFDNPLIQPVKAIALDTKLSARTIQVRFKKYVGYNPKSLLRFIRFKQVLQRLQEQPHTDTDWYDIIHDFGYHDQSHLIKDFQYFLGTTPQHFVTQIRANGFCISQPGKYY
ncbi:helix-turn-helix domain-containing protein [Chitinophaga nivalis]|uniref:Helix-turn-helix domain-containing protein n=1 Tax=Chitinophaga nivalis TaxID=2991709 RepID=A0ABT3IGU8_9BACT|nr:helix-turn-helix domain-containing protein [Chitinophaga nivalis]MCW3467137.1 helix-turn-helix domain-containing protein [Chitinophaga nivalis]MCW3483172.1 helix-turn-helix domain-containing protein [Chitinophaga nivalis]